MVSALRRALEVVAKLRALDRSTDDGAASANALRDWLARCDVASLLDEAGFRVEGPGDALDEQLCGRYWWTLLRPRWSGIECGGDFATETQARGDAVSVLLSDEDLDWEGCAVRDQALGNFAANFSALMAAFH